MALVSMRQLLDHAAENGYGLPAFNVNNLEQVKAIMEAATARMPKPRAGVFPGRNPRTASWATIPFPHLTPARCTARR